MGTPFESATRKTIRQRILYNVGGGIISTVTTGASKVLLTDTVGLAKGGDDEYVGCQIQMNSGSNNTGLQRWVTDSDGTNKTITFADLTDNLTAADAYELWRPPYEIASINNEISQMEAGCTSSVFVDKSDTTVFTEKNRYQYSIPTGFIALHTVEYVDSIDEYVDIDLCNSVWDEQVDTDVVASLDTEIHRQGGGCLKLEVADACGAGDILASQVISSKDLRNCDAVEIWIYSTVALTAGYIQLLLDNTALCASATETLSIPATTANVWTRHIISLANPQSDSAIISVGLKMNTDVGSAFTLYADYIKAVGANSRNYQPLHPDFWEIVHGSTDYLAFTSTGLGIMGNNTLLRLNGYQALTAMTSDTSSSQVDPEYLVNAVSGKVLLTYAAPRGMDNKERRAKGEYYSALAERQKKNITTSLIPGTRFI